MEPKKNTKPNIFSDEEIKSLTALGEVLRGIHNRLIEEGYTIKGGVIKKADKK
jgi:hypothetical protein